MAYLRRRADGRIEVRETIASPAGPRARTLAIFRGPLSPELLERARARAIGHFDAHALGARAAALGVPTTARRADAPARELLARLRAGGGLQPVLVSLLAGALAERVAAQAPEELSEAATWLGVGDRRRGEALRGLVRTADRIARHRPARRQRRAASFPRFRSRRRGRRSR